MDFQNKSPVDLGKVQQMIGTDQELFRSLVDIFTEEAGAQLSAIEKSITNTDSTCLDNSSHSFKSSLATLGAITVSNLAEQLELIGKAGSVNGSLKIFTQLKLEYEKVASYLESGRWIKDWDLYK